MKEKTQREDESMPLQVRSGVHSPPKPHCRSPALAQTRLRQHLGKESRLVERRGLKWCRAKLGRRRSKRRSVPGVMQPTFPELSALIFFEHFDKESIRLGGVSFCSERQREDNSNGTRRGTRACRIAMDHHYHPQPQPQPQLSLSLSLPPHPPQSHPKRGRDEVVLDSNDFPHKRDSPQATISAGSPGASSQRNLPPFSTLVTPSAFEPPTEAAMQYHNHHSYSNGLHTIASPPLIPSPSPIPPSSAHFVSPCGPNLFGAWQEGGCHPSRSDRSLLSFCSLRGARFCSFDTN